ncbi:RNA polymerase II mediator complex subunit [Paraphaeosphaeria sporulosa]|uniref:Mediator of RNA polymerase II transcription subunit 10 n=1 Tax=Paraphaeosphaeria sporulosa TaxID=1460663 RepID=A0A177CH17_9PLEO|nr:mediator of RNA polymerase II transcription subunit 10 [Paraphaeosphaeria sporulosa]OAG06242.1 mediator of RNA polymerase II transcription subunit 10 [Paraphaeosphaeria sporulosa]
MAPSNSAAPVAVAEEHMKEIVQSLYNLIVQGYDHQGALTVGAMKRDIQHLIEQLVKLSQMAPDVHINIPPEVTQYVESARNPDIFTREFVETVQRMNQLLKGRQEAYRLLQETLARDFIQGVPELKDDITKVVEATGGKVSPTKAANT